MSVPARPFLRFSKWVKADENASRGNAKPFYRRTRRNARAQRKKRGDVRAGLERRRYSERRQSIMAARRERGMRSKPVYRFWACCCWRRAI
jgi:hypothetical protein